MKLGKFVQARQPQEQTRMGQMLRKFHFRIYTISMAVNGLWVELILLKAKDVSFIKKMNIFRNPETLFDIMS
jgi:hypothetical protein